VAEIVLFFGVRGVINYYCDDELVFMEKLWDFIHFEGFLGDYCVAWDIYRH